MKTISHALSLPVAAIRLSRLMFVSALALTSCQKDQEPRPVSPFEGKWQVLKYNPANNYTLRIYPHGEKPQHLNIDNFGGYLHVPLTAQIKGEELIIPQQTFSDGQGHDLILTGHATIVSDTLRLHYEDSGDYGFITDAKAVRVQ